ncbi:hypothetical protein GCM10023317_40700 [Actinopolymorpha pittospori]
MVVVRLAPASGLPGAPPTSWSLIAVFNYLTLEPTIAAHRTHNADPQQHDSRAWGVASVCRDMGGQRP